MRVAFGVEQSGADFSARQMLAVIKIVILTSLVVIQPNQLALKSVLIVRLLVEHIRAQHNLVVLRHKRTL
jgi:hypothetical protein